MFQNENGIWTWKYAPTKEKETGYEDLLPFNAPSNDDFKELTPEEQRESAKKVLDIIRTRNIFPVYYFNEDGIKKQIQKVIDKEIGFQNDELKTCSSLGLLLLDYLFPELHRVQSGNLVSNSMYERFFDDEKMVDILARYMRGYKFTNGRTYFFMMGRLLWNTATNFAPMRAKAIVEKFTPVGGTVYDYCAGFGGRMLGTLSSKKNYKYICTDVNKSTVQHLQDLGALIESVTGRKNSYEVHSIGCEELMLEPKSVDFCFSCPPYYKLERYSDDEGQSTTKYPEYYDWLDNFVFPSIANCEEALKKDGRYGVILNDFQYHGNQINIVNDWIDGAAMAGLELENAYPIFTRARKDANKGPHNQEQLYIFKRIS